MAAENIVTVRGSLRSVYGSLRRLSETVKNREALGFPTLVHEAEWMYLTERDDRVCFFCKQFLGTIHRGNYIPNRFPLYRFIDDQHIAPEIHLLHPFLRGVCRCRLELMNIEELCRLQLHREMYRKILDRL